MRKDQHVPVAVSCLAEGLLLVDGTSIERLDTLPSAGLAAGPPLAARAVHDPAETALRGELLLADGRTLSVAGLLDAHELAWAGDLLACVSTLANAVLWVDRRGRVVGRLQAAGEGDCWHLSGIAATPGGLLVTAFGRFARHRDWAEAGRDAAGFVWELPSGRVVAEGLSSPHSPRLLEGELAVCDSGRGELVVGPRRVALGGWTRGLAITATELVVGVSAARGTAACAELVFLRRSDLSVVRRLALPVREVFAVAELSRAEARALSRPQPVPRPTTPLPSRDLRAGLTAPESLALRRSSLATVTCEVANLGSSKLGTAAPHPVFLASSWGPGRGLWSPLPRPLPPGHHARVRARLLAPPRPGRYSLELRLVQEGVAWLEGGARVAVTVT
jgi:hypothetical protein